MPGALNNHHRDTLRKIFAHPTSGNIEWREVLSLLRAVGSVSERHDGKFKVTVGPETEVMSRPRGKDVDVRMVTDLRRMLVQAGLSPGGGQAIGDERSRDHGDGRWGAQTVSGVVGCGREGCNSFSHFATKVEATALPTTFVALRPMSSR